MLLYGASGHARVIVSCLYAAGTSVDAIFDDDLRKKSLCNIPVVSGYQADYKMNEQLIIAVGNNMVRHRLAQLICHSSGIAIHPSAQIDPAVKMGNGCVVFQGSILQANTRLGSHVIINTAASVDHDCSIADFVHVAPGVILCGGIRVETGAFIGAGAIVCPNLTIGRWAVIGAGTVVTKSIPDYAVVAGNPARIIKMNTPL